MAPPITCRDAGSPTSSQDTDYQREMVQRLRLPFAVLSDTALALADRLELRGPGVAIG